MYKNLEEIQVIRNWPIFLDQETQRRYGHAKSYTRDSTS